MDTLSKQVLDRYNASYDSLATKRSMWDEMENIFGNRLNDSISANTKSQVMDQKLSTLILEREARVMAKVPIGKFRPISSNDMSSSKIMNMTMEKYIIPNARAQFPFLTKMRMMDRYSNIYGNMFALTDWDVKKNGYIGPDVWLLPIRDCFPQFGATSLEDSEHFIVRTWKPKSYFEGLARNKSYKNIAKILEFMNSKAGSKDVKPSEERSKREETQYPNGINAKGSGYWEVLSQFEGDRWVDYQTDSGFVFRDQANPHDNGELPIVCKYSIPLIDDFMGMGDFERGKTMQYTLNSLWNLYLDAIKISIFPPTVLNKDNIIASTIKWGPGAKWLVRNSVGNSVQQLAISPRGIETFQGTYQVVNASLLNMFGTSDTSVTASTDPGFGKTPQALAMQKERENSKDNVDRFYMEQTLTDIMRKFANLWSKKQPKQITMRLFEDEIEQLAKIDPKINDAYDKKSGKLTLKKEMTGSTLYDYEIVSGSTYALDHQDQVDTLTKTFGLVTQNMTVGQDGKATSPMLMRLKEEGIDVKVGELLKSIVADSSVRDWSKIIVDENENSNVVTPEDEQALMEHQQQFLQALQGMNGGAINQIPPQGQPQGMPPQMQPQPQVTMNQNVG